MDKITETKIRNEFAERDEFGRDPFKMSNEELILELHYNSNKFIKLNWVLGLGAFVAGLIIGIAAGGGV